MKSLKTKLSYLKPSVFYLGIALIIQSIICLVVYLTSANQSLDAYDKFYARNNVLITFVTLIFMIAILVSRKSVRKFVKEQTKNKMTYKYLYLVVFGAVISVCGSLLASVFAKPGSNAITYNGSIPMQIITLVILAPLVEEIIFRGLTFVKVKKDLGANVGIIITTLLFAICHLSNMQQAVFDVLLGACLIFVYELYGDLKAPILTHIVCNLTSVICNQMEWSIHQDSKILAVIIAVIPIGVALFELNLLNKEKIND